MNRSRFQGLATVVRFNWHFFLIAGLGIIGMLVLALFVPGQFALILNLVAFGAFLSTAASLFATYLAYDQSGLYQLEWLTPYMEGVKDAANIHAGFDETTHTLREVYPDLKWQVFDFYDPQKHTEVSIRRARKAQPPISDTLAIKTDDIPAEDASLNLILLTLAGHEIRDDDERVRFFKELRRTLSPKGKIIVSEHLRDLPNLLAYSFGAFHFHSKSTWLETFEKAGLNLERQISPAPLIHSFILRK